MHNGLIRTSDLTNCDYAIIGDRNNSIKELITMISTISDDGTPLFDINALLSWLFSFFNNFMQDAIGYDESIRWYLYENFGTIEENEKMSVTTDINMLSKVLKDFIKLWLEELREAGLIKDEHLNYDFAGLLRDGSVLFRRVESTD